jgi:hypothetical protein
MGTAPDAVKRLVDRFYQDRKVFLSGDYKGEQLLASCPPARHSAFVVRTSRGPVIHEESIKVAGATKAPDYTFRIDGRSVFFAEAKKPAVNVAEDARTLDPAARRGILTKQTRGET